MQFDNSLSFIFGICKSVKMAIPRENTNFRMSEFALVQLHPNCNFKVGVHYSLAKRKHWKSCRHDRNPVCRSSSQEHFFRLRNTQTIQQTDS